MKKFLSLLVLVMGLLCLGTVVGAYETEEIVIYETTDCEGDYIYVNDSYFSSEEYYKDGYIIFLDAHSQSGYMYLYSQLYDYGSIDRCEVLRKSEGGAWKSLGDALFYDYDEYYADAEYFDYTVVYGKSYDYRFCYYDGGDLVTTRDISTKHIGGNSDGYYYKPKAEAVSIGDKTVKFTVTLDERWSPDSYKVTRKQGYWGDEVLVGEYKKFPDTTASDGYSLYVIELSDKGLEPGTDYTYYIDFYSDSSTEPLCSTQLDVQTTYPLVEPELISIETSSNSITMTASIDERWEADGYDLQKYSFKLKKWIDAGTSEYFGYHDWKGGHEIYEARFTFEKLKPITKYKCRMRFFKMVDGKKEYISDVTKTTYTMLETPELELGATAKKATLSWDKVSKAAGYEIYVKALSPNEDAGDYWGDYWWWYGYSDDSGSSLSKYNQSYESSTLYGISPDLFKKKTTVKGGSKTSYSYSIKSSKIYVYRIRAYKTINGTKYYSDFSNQVTTDCTESLLNGLKLKPTVTVSASNEKLIKAALKKCITDDMSQAEKAAAIYDYVHNAAIYEYTYSRIPSDPIEAILSAGRGQCYQFAVTYQAMMKYIGFDVKLVSGKTSRGGPHWWNELTCAGTTYMIDPQVGGRFLIRYDRMGAYTVKKEKVYD